MIMKEQICEECWKPWCLTIRRIYKTKNYWPALPCRLPWFFGDEDDLVMCGCQADVCTLRKQLCACALLEEIENL